MKKNIAEKGLFTAVFWAPLVNIIMYVGLLISFFASLNVNMKKIKLDYAFLAFTFAVFLSVFTSIDKIQSIYGFIAFLAYPIAYFVSAKNINGQNLGKVIKLIEFSLIAILLAGFLQSLIPVHFLLKYNSFFDNLGWVSARSIWKGARFVSTMGNPNVLGAYLVLVLPVLGALFISKPSLKMSAVLFPGILMLIMTYSRSAWIGFFVSILIFFFITKSRKIIFFGLGLLVLLVAVPAFNNRFINSGINAFFMPGGRLTAWKTGLQIIGQYPLFGTGPNTFVKVSPLFTGQLSENFVHAHNIFLNIGAETGLAGMSVFIVFITFFFIMAYRLCAGFSRNKSPDQYRWVIAGLISGMTGFLAQNMFDYFLSRGQIGVLFFIMMGILRGLWKNTGLQNTA